MSSTYKEIKNQPMSWRQTLKQTTQDWNSFKDRLTIRPNTHFLFIGCGTSFYLSQTSAALFQELTGHVSRAIPGSEVFLTSGCVIPNEAPTIAFAISRSGTTSEVLLAVEYLQHHYPNVQVVGVTCNSEEGLSKIVPITISLEHVKEESVVMTQSFTNMVLALQVIAAKIANREDILTELSRLPEVLEAEFETYEDIAKSIGQNISYHYYVFLGLGKYYGLANEACLKLKEMTQVFCEAYGPLEFRHGPISMVTNQACVLLLQGHEAGNWVKDVATDVFKSGALTAILQPFETCKAEMDGATFVQIGLQGTFDDWVRTILYMPTLQLLAYHRAISLGCNPDQPRNLTQVVVLANEAM